MKNKNQRINRERRLHILFGLMVLSILITTLLYTHVEIVNANPLIWSIDEVLPEHDPDLRAQQMNAKTIEMGEAIESSNLAGIFSKSYAEEEAMYEMMMRGRSRNLLPELTKIDMSAKSVVVTKNTKAVDYPHDDAVIVDEIEKGSVVTITEFYEEGYGLLDNGNYIETASVELHLKNVKPLSSGSTVKTKSGLTATEINSFLSGSKLAGLGQSIINTEEKYNINAFLITSVMVLESGWGYSNIAKDKNNLFGLGAYDYDPYNKAISFSSKAECIDYFGRLMLSYNKKGKTTVGRVGATYCTSNLWAKKVTTVSTEISEHVNKNRAKQRKEFNKIK